jgi:glutamate/tyrosine decarboxylase-like PLP-dependent enzyme
MPWKQKVDWESLFMAWTMAFVLMILLAFTAWTGAKLECVLGAFASFVAGGSLAGMLGYRMGRKRGREDTDGKDNGHIVTP